MTVCIGEVYIFVQMYPVIPPSAPGAPAAGPRVRAGRISMQLALTKSSSQRRWSGTASAAADLANRVLPFVLSLIAGSTDIIGFLGLNGLFTAHITGNVVVLAAHIVAGDPTIFSYVLSVPVFMMALFLTRLVAGGLEQIGVSTLRPLLLLQLFFLLPSSRFALWRVHGVTPTRYSRSSRVCAGSRRWRCRMRSCRSR